MSHEYKTVDKHVDDLQIPHRRLTESELYQIFTTIEWQVHDYYRAADDVCFTARQQAEERLAHITDALNKSHRFAELDAELTDLIRDPRDFSPTERAERRARHSTLWAEHQQMQGPKKDAEASLKQAQVDYANITAEQGETNLILCYLTGQRAGLRLGLKVAAMLLEGAPVAGIDHPRASLMVAGAMTDDNLADALVTALLQAETSAT